MGQALYRKHRPKSLAEIVGQEHITETLAKALEQGRISHAYLFTGPRGVGKTSIARILAHEINGLPYSDDSAHLDIIEIDAASNRRIDEIRELREKVYVAPTSAKYKVYIIDEVHMLTREAFNALLKTLEEPPAHVVFILATTDAHKLPETIISRTQRFNFKPGDPAKVVALLQRLAKQENIAVSPEALQLLAEHGEGSFRDSVSLLDQASSHDKRLEAADIQTLLGIPSATAVQALLQSLHDGSAVSLLMKQLTDLYGAGYQATAIAKQIGQLIRQQLVNDELAIEPDQALDLLAHLIEVPLAHDPERYLELTLLRACNVSKKIPAQPATSKEEPAREKPHTPEPKPESIQTTSKIEESMPPITEKVAVKPAVSATIALPSKLKVGGTALDDTIWPQVLQLLKQRHNTLYGVVRMAQPTFSPDDTLTLKFAFAFHEKRIREASNRQRLATIIEELTGQIVTVECVLDKTAIPPKSLPGLVDTTLPADLSAISNIFGDAELLES